MDRPEYEETLTPAGCAGYTTDGKRNTDERSDLAGAPSWHAKIAENCITNKFLLRTLSFKSNKRYTVNEAQVYRRNLLCVTHVVLMKNGVHNDIIPLS